ncbi:hypothetical protein [Agrobacterium sp.]|uniref:hypothetical protein n=1 Tax=Agrobacterium sp. TaxID=361 RepID=UPI0040332D15
MVRTKKDSTSLDSNSDDLSDPSVLTSPEQETDPSFDEGLYNAETVTTDELLQRIPPTGLTEIFDATITETVTVSDKAAKEKLTNKDLESIISDVARFYETTTSIAYLGICATLQAGGTNRNKRSNVKITINKITFESKKVNEFISRQCKNLTVRQFARLIANDIIHIAVRYQITGNAYVSLKRYYPKLLLGSNQLERYWASDFQVENILCPDYIRTALRQRYADKFTTNK